MLSDALWRSRYGADPGVLGREVTLNGDVFRVIGVARPSFRYPAGAQVWIPTFLPGDTTFHRGMNFLRPVAMLRPGVSIAQAREASVAVGRVTDRASDVMGNAGDVVRNLAEAVAGPRTLLVAGAASAAGRLLQRWRRRSSERGR